MKTQILIVLSLLTLTTSAFAQSLSDSYGTTCGGQNEDREVIAAFAGMGPLTPDSDHKEIMNNINENGDTLRNNLLGLLKQGDNPSIDEETIYHWGKVAMCFYVQALKQNSLDRPQHKAYKDAINELLVSYKATNPSGRKAKILNFLTVNKDSVAYLIMYFNPDRDKSNDKVRGY